MELSSQASLIELRDKYLIVIHMPSGPRGLEVNESFAWLWKQAVGHPFTREDLVHALMAEYGLPEPEAAAETDNILRLWKDYGLLP